MSALPFLDLSGTPLHLGRAHGEALRDAISENVALYFRAFEIEGGLSHDLACERGGRYLAVIQRAAPDYAEMVHGIAEGSGRDLLEIAALNARYELLYSEFSRQLMEDSPPAGVRAPSRPAGARRGDGCTAFVALPEATADGHLLLGENWDWMAGARGALVRVTQPDGFRTLSFTEAGIAGGKIGLNSAGLGLAINGLASSRDAWERLKTPFHTRTWRVLSSRTLDDAVAAITDEERSCSANFLLAQVRDDGSVDAVDVETAPATYEVIRPQRTLAHANHFFDPASLDVWQPIDERSSTYARCTRLQSLLDSGAGSLTPAAMQALLRDHQGYPLSVCSHPSPLWPPDEQYHTVFSAVMDLHAGTMWAAPGPPCQHEYTKYTVD